MTLITALVVSLVTGLASAQPRPRPVLEPGREVEVQALFEPHRLGAEVTAGWALWGLSITGTGIEVSLRGPSGATHRFELVHPEGAPAEAPRSASFAALFEPTDDAGAAAARERLFGAVREHDPGGFWRVIPEPVQRVAGGPRDPRKDGVVLTGLGLLVVLALMVRSASSGPRWAQLVLLGALVGGAALRVTLSPDTVLGAWPWSRLWPNVRWIWESASFERLTLGREQPVYLTDLTGWVNLGYAVVTPAVVFAHAAALMRDARVAAVAAAVVAVLPQHLRFSHCEDAFVPSIVMSSLAFALLHTWMRDPSRVARGVALVLLPAALYPGLSLRPLNVLFIVVYLAAIVWLHPEAAPRGRRVVAGALVIAVGTAALVHLVMAQTETVAEAARLGWIFSIPWVLLNPYLNPFLAPSVTPPILLLLAGFGFHRLRRTGSQRMAWFLVGWAALFFVAHCFVVQESMQPRYLLHLMVPFVLLTAVGVFEVAERSRRAATVSVVAVALAPLTHLSFIRDRSYTDQVEYDFLRSHRDAIPEGCTVIEVVAQEHNERFVRLGQRAGGASDQRFVSLAVRPPATAPLDAIPPAVTELLAAPPECVVFYHGYGCWAAKPPEAPIAPLCPAIQELAPMDPIARMPAPSNPYDTAAAPGLTERDHVELSLWRVRPRQGGLGGHPGPVAAPHQPGAAPAAPR